MASGQSVLVYLGSRNWSVYFLVSADARFSEQIGFQKGVATCVDCIWEVLLKD